MFLRFARLFFRLSRWTAPAALVLILLSSAPADEHSPLNPAVHIDLSSLGYHDSQIDLYDLPKISEEEQAKFTALKADVRGLYIVAKSDSDEVDEPVDDIPPVPSPGAGEANTSAEEPKTEPATAVVASDPSSEPGCVDVLASRH